MRNISNNREVEFNYPTGYLKTSIKKKKKRKEKRKFSMVVSCTVFVNQAARISLFQTTHKSSIYILKYLLMPLLIQGISCFAT